MSLSKMRLRTVLLVAFCFSCLLMFSSIRCALFSLSCTSVVDEPFKDLLQPKYDSSDKDIEKFFNVGIQGDEQGANGTSSPANRTLKRTVMYRSYDEALKSRADAQGVIVLVSTDFGYINMALNLYFTSLKKFNITNYLYLTSDNDAAAELRKNNIAHFKMAEDKDGKKMSEYGSAAFIRKTHIKTKIILEALKLGYTVLIVDVDIVFLKNPFLYLTCATCDIQIQSDGPEGNSGFYLARPTSAGITLHKTALETAARSKGLSNQKAVDRAMERMSRAGALKMKMLALKEFPHGLEYFEKGHRMFGGDNPCTTCVIVHNNWLVSGAAKVYRFKEHLMWQVNKAGYYSDASAKYLRYDNPIDFGSGLTVTMETEALRTALQVSHLLGRILILPAFHCYGCTFAACNLPKNSPPHKARCSLNTHFRIKSLDEVFANKYREHVFLQHPLVPSEVLQSQSEPILIRTDVVTSRLQPNELKAIKNQFSAFNASTSITSEELVKWLEPFSSLRVMRFHSLYKIPLKLSPQHIDKAFEAGLVKGLRKAGYRQY